MARKHAKKPIPELIKLMRPEQQRVSRQILEDYKELLVDLPGSTHNHQAWPGGYISHLEEAMNIAILLFDTLSAKRPLPFELSDALFALFIHDFDKLTRYEKVDGKYRSRNAYSSDYITKTVEVLRDNYDYALPDEIFNAIKYAHGEGADYTPGKRTILPLGTLVHCCDILSARLWFDEGRNSDNW